ncbi:helix-turn-helix domain-containing protein [Spirulina sp. CS-785/01]|uniref:ArsR/SmtB family transcription factor n=1 Tax=Spirulina sp. CS-785/01 TaxID=3021716 RepID=UPI00232EE500|nr:Clp protease N-terminal domain-containing protein [Spirulina sp. CS-785/01]MDB9313755.1 helix-turn-helix domain-containing protein [Spirulina sp. CS-785/01]
MKTNNITRYADLLAALGSPTRLTLIRLLVKKHPQGMIAGELQARLQLTPEKLRYHLEKLKQQGLIQVNPDGDNLVYTVDVSLLEDLLAFFYAEWSVRQQIVDWDRVHEKKDAWLKDSLAAELADPDNLEHLLPLSIYERLGGKALQVLLLARSESSRIQHNFIGTEQILLGLMREGSGNAAKSLYDWGMQLDQARIAVQQFIGEGRGSGEEIPFTPRAQQVLHYALEEAIAGGHIIINTEHLLLGIVREWEISKQHHEPLSVASKLLSQVPVSPQEMLQHLREL